MLDFYQKKIIIVYQFMLILGNSLKSLYAQYEYYQQQETTSVTDAGGLRKFSERSTRFTGSFLYMRKRFRLLAAVPPILGAALVSDLGKITDYTGITGFAIAFIFPALLGLYSEHRCVSSWVRSDTPYSHLCTSRPWQMASLTVGIGLSVFVLGSLLWNDLN